MVMRHGLTAKERTYPFLTEGLCLARAAVDALRSISGWWLISRNFEFGPSDIMLQVERIELSPDIFQGGCLLQTLVGVGLGSLRVSLLLLLGLLGANDALVPQSCLEPLELGATSHGKENERRLQKVASRFGQDEDRSAIIVLYIFCTYFVYMSQLLGTSGESVEIIIDQEIFLSYRYLTSYKYVHSTYS